MSNEKRLIDANALMAQLEERQAFLIKEWGYRDHYARGFVEAVDKLDDAPTVDAVEVVHGEWIYENGEWVCSVCKEPALYEVQVYGGGNYKDCDLVRSNYCPNCGAKMDGGNENE